MPTIRSILSALITLLTATALQAGDTAKNCGCPCCEGEEVCCCNDEPEAKAEITHPLKGIIVNLLPERSALLVKHEAIPGYMRAMTMLFQVNAATLATVKQGQVITATLVKRDDTFWLENIQPAEAPKP